MRQQRAGEQHVYQGTTQVDYETWGYDGNENVTWQLDNVGNVTSSTYNGHGVKY